MTVHQMIPRKNDQSNQMHTLLRNKNTAQERTADEPPPQINTQSMIAKLMQTRDEEPQAV